MEIKDAAAILLGLRVIAMIFMAYVLKEQMRLLRENNPPDVQLTRWILFIFALILFLGNIIPMIIDLVTLFTKLDRETDPSALSLSYAFNNAGTDAIQAVVLFGFYIYQRANSRMFGRRKTEAERT